MYKQLYIDVNNLTLCFFSRYVSQINKNLWFIRGMCMFDFCLFDLILYVPSTIFQL